MRDELKAPVHDHTITKKELEVITNEKKLLLEGI